MILQMLVRCALTTNPIYYSIANHFFTAGLWRADALTGENEKLIEGLDDEGRYTLVAYPRQLSDDGLLYSFTTITDNPDPSDILPLAMYRSNADGTELEPLRGDNYFLSEVLWQPTPAAQWLRRSYLLQHYLTCYGCPPPLALQRCNLESAAIICDGGH